MTFFNAPAFRRQYPRDGEDWGLAEDRRLARLVKKQVLRIERGPRTEAWRRVSRLMGRTILAVQNRWQVLKVVGAHLKASKRRKRK